MKTVLAGYFVDELPARLTDDRTYDSDGLDAQLAAEYRIELIVLYCHGRKRETQDSRKLRPSSRR